MPRTRQADRGAEQLLLGNEHLEEALGMGLLELVGMGRVGHLGIEGDDVRSAAAQRRQGVAVGLARRLLAADRVRGQRRRSAVRAVGSWFSGFAVGTVRWRSPPSSAMAAFA